VIDDLTAALRTWLRACGDAARGLLWRGVLFLAATVAGAVGCGFVIFAAYAALRPHLGPELAALVTGLTLLALAALLVWLARTDSGRADLARADGPRAAINQPDIRPVNPVPPEPAPPKPADPAMMAVFTAAFVLGRQLARRRD